MRKITTEFFGKPTRTPYRTVTMGNLVSEWRPDISFAVLLDHVSQSGEVSRLEEAGLGNVIGMVSSDARLDDVIIPDKERNRSIVVYRESDQHHALFLTNRCNSYCLMCSQPPTSQDDSWLVGQARSIVRHIAASPQRLGLTGGEPLLLGRSLRLVIEEISSHHPSTKIEVLTNGRLLGDDAIADLVLEQSLVNTSWLVPLYGHADFIHDFVVQAPGAFDQTIAGLLNLQSREQPIQLRIVLIEPVLQVLTELCTFIGRNLPFVREVAFMACEPIGFALANRAQCEVDLLNWSDTLAESARILKRHDVPHLFMNTPLCSIPQTLWKYAHKSISDWKNVYPAECSSCKAKQDCSGLFAWHEKGWKPSRVKPFTGVLA